MKYSMTKKTVIFLSIFCAGTMSTTKSMDSDSHLHEVEITTIYLERNDFRGARKHVRALRHENKINGETRQKLEKLIAAKELDVFMCTAMAEESKTTNPTDDHAPVRERAESTTAMTYSSAAVLAAKQTELEQMKRHTPLATKHITSFDDFQVFETGDEPHGYQDLVLQEFSIHPSVQKTTASSSSTPATHSDEPKSDSRVLLLINPAIREEARKLLLNDDFDTASALLHTSGADEETIARFINDILDQQCTKL